MLPFLFPRSGLASWIWVRDFDNWHSWRRAVVGNIVVVLANAAWTKAFAWTKRKDEFQKSGWGSPWRTYLA